MQKAKQIYATSLKGADDALRQTFIKGFDACAGKPHVHFILKSLTHIGREWTAEIDLTCVTLCQIPRFLDVKTNDAHRELSRDDMPAQISALYLQRQHEDAYQKIAQDFSFTYVHIMDTDARWNTLFLHTPDLDLYEATHPPQNKEKDQNESDSSGSEGLKAFSSGEATHSKSPARPYIHPTHEHELRRRIEDHFWMTEFEKEQIAQTEREHDLYYRENNIKMFKKFTDHKLEK